MRRGYALLLLASALCGCSSAVTGAGTAASRAGSTSSVAGFPSPVGTATFTGSPATSSRATPPSSAPSRKATQLSVTGSETGKPYAVQLWAVDHVTDCAAHAYGTKIVSFLRAHPCQSATRRLFTLDLDGRTVAVSTVAVTLPPYGGGSSADIYRYAGQFVQLENANGTGSMNDLLREGVRVPGVQSAIPSNEAFLVAGQDLGVTIFDAWYVTGPTPDQAVALVAVEHDLTLTPVSVDQ